ncbi:hypothetical protein ACFXDJ_18180 [Streptomyces sp. NPDC059443]|uniref:hypothetical protein n=1 Tax=unclassified Streptomyces TaxID=2593676 RepID=UPI00367CFC40
MALCFELVVNLGDSIRAAWDAALTEPRSRVLHAGAQRIPLHRPMLRTTGPHVELSVLPVAVGWGVGLDGSLLRFPLSAAEFTALGHQLYELLAKFDGYLIARVVWDPESLLDPAELKAEGDDRPTPMANTRLLNMRAYQSQGRATG